MGIDPASIAFLISVWALPVILAVTLHEAAHGFVAHMLGDDTAYRLGRVTFNPIRHIDPFGTLLLPAALLWVSGGQMMFGAAKPVPVNAYRLRHPRRDMVLVALAGPGTNLILALVALIGLHFVNDLPVSMREWVGLNLGNMAWINVLLAVFNMLPLPPLDGGRVAVGVLPRALAYPLARLERAGIFILLGALFILPWLGNQIGVRLDVFRWLIGEPSRFILNGMARMVGLT